MASQVASSSTAPIGLSSSHTLRDSLKANASTLLPSSRHAEMDSSIDLTTPPPEERKETGEASGITTKRSAEELTADGEGDKDHQGSQAKKVKAASPGDAADASTGKPKAAHGQGVLCHQHRAPCPGTLIRCTVIKQPQNVRCPLKFCASSLKNTYDQSAEEILGAGRARPGLDLSEHCSAEEAKYIWKCPRCRGNCRCSMCRKTNGLEPVVKKKAPAKTGPKKVGKKKEANGLADAPKEKKAKTDVKASGSGSAKLDGNGDDLLDTSVKKFDFFGHHKARMSNGSASSSGTGKSAKAGPSGSVPVLDAMGQSRILAPKQKPKPPAQPKAMKQTSLPRPLLPPTRIRPPQLDVLDTRLPPPNVIERMWIYETLVRFDAVKVPKKILSSLDRFDRWPERDLQTLLERILSSLAGLEYISRGQPKKPFVTAVEAFREHGGKVGRGEAWAAAKDVYERVRNTGIRELQDVEPEPLQIADTADDDKMPEDPGRTLLGDRRTRARRGAELAAIEKVKAISLKEQMGASSSYDDDEDDSEADSDDDEDEDDFGHGGRRSTRTTTPDSEDEAPRKAGRNDWVRRSERRRPASDRSSAKDKKPAAKARAAATRSSTRSTRATVAAAASGSSRDSPASSLSSASPAPETKSTAARSKPARAASPIPAPCFEERVAILSGLCELLLDTEMVTNELKASVDQVMALEKDVRDELRRDGKDHGEQMKEMKKKAPSIAQKEEYAKWKEDMAEMERDHKYSVLDAKVTQQIQLDALKLRTGPLGRDSDGNVYWQLSEFNERLPADTEGRWAWRLICLGKPESFEHKIQAEDAPIGKGKGKAKEEEESVLLQPALMPQDPCEYPDGAKFLGSGDAMELQRLIRWVRYRLELKEYEEAMQERVGAEAAIAVARAAADGLGPPKLTALGKAYSELKPSERKEMKLRAAWRREDVDRLVQRLEIVKDYYSWHTSNLDELKHEPWVPAEGKEKGEEPKRDEGEDAKMES